MREGFHHHPQEAELRSSKDCESATHERHGSHGLHPRRRAQLARALRSHAPRRTCEGLDRGPISHSARSSRYAGSREEETGSFSVRILIGWPAAISCSAFMCLLLFVLPAKRDTS